MADRKLSVEERILWGKIAKSTRALPGRLADLLEFEAAFEEKPVTPKPSKVTTAPIAPMTFDASYTPVPQVKKPSGLHHPLEKPVKRKLSRGHIQLEARIDLHGLIQGEAHGILLDFLMRAHDRGLRHVLVITGKGSSLGSEGALKRAVPLWFSKPEYRYLISSYEQAAQHHGGEGALYVRLSRGNGA